jgi:hypothetical protein
MADLLARDAATEPAAQLIERVLMQDDYGTYAGRPKVGKTWLATDLAISAATGTPWFGHFATARVPVLMFAGEGGRRRLLRRLDAVAQSRGIDIRDIDLLRVSLRAPVMTDGGIRDAMACELYEHPAALIMAEPFYLMGRGIGRNQLNEIGAVLGACQEVAEEAGAALLLGDHWNKGGAGIGADRITGAGMQEWSRVIINGLLEYRQADQTTGGTVAQVRWDVSGEMPDLGFKIRRSVTPEDRSDPYSRLVYDCRYLGEHDPSTTAALSEEAERLLTELRSRGADETHPARASDVRASAGVPSKRASDFWNELHACGLIESTGRGRSGTTFHVWPTEGRERF